MPPPAGTDAQEATSAQSSGASAAAQSGPSQPLKAAKYPCMTASQAAAQAGDFGRKPHELPWFYLDSVDQEYGPVHSVTMREWLTLGRFPVGGDLRVRLPEWDVHLPLHKLYPDLTSAFILPPAWPDVISDDASAAVSGQGASAVDTPASMPGQPPSATSARTTTLPHAKQAPA
mmetsp:Transcript_5145/g.8979  ORF Transcript_5145/g.8979 Transcript_5145/m.8979 type:complete len:174 (-) Transcript_5145:81-602(-)